MNSLPRLNSLWVGNHLGYIEKLCLVSALSTGHQVTLYSYTAETLQDVPDGVELRDAREVMPEEDLVSYAGSGSFALGSNFFRYALLAKGLGLWIDLDLCFLKPIDFEDQYIFGWQDEVLINGAVLCVPPRSDIVREFCELPKSNRRPPWFGPKRTVLYYMSRLVRGAIHVTDMPWGTFGPQMVTYLVKKHNVVDRAQPPHVFYPLKWPDARLIYGPADAVDSMIRPETRTIHLWYSALYDLRDRPPPVGSYIDTMCRRHGIDTH